jgi:hypothetical protein
MAQRDHIIIGIHVQDRVKQAVGIQQILTDYGAMIKTRLGLHEVDSRAGAGKGIILLELTGPAIRVSAMVRRLRACKGVDVKQMVFAHA